MTANETYIVRGGCPRLTSVRLCVTGSGGGGGGGLPLPTTRSLLVDEHEYINEQAMAVPEVSQRMTPRKLGSQSRARNAIKKGRHTRDQVRTKALRGIVVLVHVCAKPQSHPLSVALVVLLDVAPLRCVLYLLGVAPLRCELYRLRIVASGIRARLSFLTDASEDERNQLLARQGTLGLYIKTHHIHRAHARPKSSILKWTCPRFRR